MKILRVNLGDRGYPILIQKKILSEAAVHIRDHAATDQAVIISDRTVTSLYGTLFMNSLTEAGIKTSLFTVNDGEESKSWETMGNLLTRCVRSELKRDGLIIALGGGVVGDLAGFVASTYLRGVRFMQVPTSLLAQVDSSVGGKVGINHALGKNLIGNFYQPRLVLIDPVTLTTLDKRELWAGMSEVLKYGLIWDGAFFKDIENNLESLVNLENMDAVVDMLAFCCRVKAEVVEQDEQESGLRRILNFGHTVGHALEAVTEYSYLKHGEAVVHGMHWAAWVSRLEKMITEEDFKRIESVLKRFPVPRILENLTTEKLISKIKIDKKQTGKGLNLVLLETIGKTVIRQVNSVDSWISSWLEYIQSAKNKQF